MLPYYYASNFTIQLTSTFKILLLTAVSFVFSQKLTAQITLNGTVYDSSRINLVEGVRVVSTGGLFAVTDSMGRFTLMVNEKDSVIFIFRNKPTQHFAVKDIPDPAHFNLSIHITVKGKYTTLKEVVVRTHSYRQDSIENRQNYADIFGYRKPGLSTSLVPGGGVGADVDQLINIFRFKRNRRLKAFQNRLEREEEDKYVDYRFNRNFVRRVSQLNGTALDSFMVRYRPSYAFAVNADEITFNRYILNSSYAFKLYLKELEIIGSPGMKKETP